MAVTNIKKVLKIITGNGGPEEGDRIVEDIQTFPTNTAYIDKDSGHVYIRVAENGTTEDFVVANL